MVGRHLACTTPPNSLRYQWRRGLVVWRVPPPQLPPISRYEVPQEPMTIVYDKRIRGLAIWFVRANANLKGRPKMKAWKGVRETTGGAVSSYFCQDSAYSFCLFSPASTSRATSPAGPQQPARKQQQPPTHPCIDQEVTGGATTSHCQKVTFRISRSQRKHRRSAHLGEHSCFPYFLFSIESDTLRLCPVGIGIGLIFASVPCQRSGGPGYHTTQAKQSAR